MLIFTSGAIINTNKMRHLYKRPETEILAIDTDSRILQVSGGEFKEKDDIIFQDANPFKEFDPFKEFNPKSIFGF